MYSLYEDIPFVCENTLLLAKKVSFLEEKQPSLPKVDLEINEDDLLKKKSISGLEERLKLENLANLKTKKLFRQIKV